MGDEVPEVHSKRVLLWKITHILIIFVNFWNFIANIVGTAQASGIEGYFLNHSDRFQYDGGVRIAISVFVFLFWLPASLFLFILPFQVVMNFEEKTWIPYVLFFLAFVFYAIWSIADFADASGFVMMGRFFDKDLGAAGFFALVYSIVALGIAALSIISIVVYYRRDAVDDD